jgi:hypothetical protein
MLFHEVFPHTVVCSVIKYEVRTFFFCNLCSVTIFSSKSVVSIP